MFRKFITVTLSFLMFFQPFSGLNVFSADVEEIYVSVDGNDNNNGTIEAPLKTISAANKLVAEIKSKSPDVPVIVYFREGEYKINSTTEFGKVNSGTTKGPVTYKSYQGEYVCFRGDVKLSASAFNGVTDEGVLERLPEGSKEKVGVLSLKNAGVKSIHKYEPLYGFGNDNIATHATLFVDNSEQICAQWPNGRQNYQGITNAVAKEAFVFDTDRCKRWTEAKDAYISGYLSGDYAYERLQILKIDVGAKSINVGRSYGISKTGRWQICNLLEEVDAPGEYYVDREKLLLYFYPPYNISKADIRLTVNDFPFFKLNNAHNLNFEGFNFKNTCKSVFELAECSDVNIRGSKFENIGTNGVLTENCSRIIVDSCDFSHIGGTCVHFSGGNDQTLEPAENEARNCDFYDWGTVKRTYTYAVALYGVGSGVVNSLMHESPHTAVYFNGNDHYIKNNEIYNVVKETADSGAIYAGRRWFHRGNKIEGNYIHDIRSNRAGESSYKAMGIYLDDCFSSAEVYNNVFKNINYAMMIGGGRDNFVYNNIFMDCDAVIRADSRGETWYRDNCSPTGFMNTLLDTVPYNKEPYTKYPGLAEIRESNLYAPMGNIVADNLMINNDNSLDSNIVKSYKENARRYENNVEYTNYDESATDVIFKNAEEEDYTIEEGSPIFDRIPTLEEINFDNIGLYTNEYRMDLNKKLGDFKLILPKNDLKEVTNESEEIRWSRCDGADFYEIQFSHEKDFSEIISTVYVRDTYYMYNGFETGTKDYYWRVKAGTMSRQLKTERFNSIGTRHFTTAEYSVLHKELLEDNIFYAERFVKLIEEVGEGENMGQFKPGSYDTIAGPLEKAREAVKIEYGYQSTIDQATEELQEAFSSLSDAMNVGYVSIESMLTDSENWITDGSVRINAEEKTVEVSSDKFSVFTFDKPVSRTNILTFDLSLNNSNSGSWVGIAMQTDKGSYIYSGKRYGYLIVVKDGIFELQKYKNTPSQMLATPANPELFVKGKEHRCEFGVIDQGAAARIIFRVDGVTVFDYVDSDGPLVEDLYFSVYHSDNKNVGYIKNVENVSSGEKTKAEELDSEEIVKSLAGNGKYENNEYKATKGFSRSDVEMSLNSSFEIGLSGDTLDNVQITFMQQGEAKPADGGAGYVLEYTDSKLMLVKYKGDRKQYLAVRKNVELYKNKENRVKVKLTSENGVSKFDIAVNGNTVISCNDFYGISQKGYIGVYNNCNEEITIYP